jgi:6-phosphogluconolactonase
MTDVLAGVGRELIRFSLDRDSGALTRGGSLTLPGRIQEGARHPSLPAVHLCCGDRDADAFWLCAVRLPRLDLLDAPAQLPSRPVDVTTDQAGRHVLTAYTGAPGLTVHELESDGSIGDPVAVPVELDTGVFAHDIVVLPGDERAVLAARGHGGHGGTPATPGALELLAYDEGRLANLASAGLNGTPFNPRNVAVHPALPYIYATLEPQNLLTAFRVEGDALTPVATFTRDLLADRAHVDRRQLAGAVEIHPSGRWAYAVNRADGPLREPRRWLTPPELEVFEHGENSIVVFALADDGEPTLLGRVDTGGISARTLGLDPTGRFLIAANSKPMIVRRDGADAVVSASLAVFAVGADGTLSEAHREVVDVGGETLWWMGVA